MNRFFILLAILAAAGIPASAAPPIELTVHDPRLEIRLFAEDPDIVTPIGLAVDSKDRVFVVESHTHGEPRDYPGPDSDRIKIFTDADRDGNPEDIRVFAEGFDDAMNLAFAPGGTLYVVCAGEVWALHDRDNDDVSESRTKILELKTTQTWAHSRLLGLTFSNDGWLYVSRGNVGGHYYEFIGSDGSKLEGYGDGGNIVRCRPDGSRLEEYATGFWNPFDIKFDFKGRLLCVDNDPDARGPNRLQHIVRYGNYGYKSLYGGGGNHPFQGWDGSMPGVLPMIAGTGESPAGVMDANRAALPLDYRNNILVTVWNEYTIDRYTTQPMGSSLSATNSVLVSGPEHFRPVALDADSQGNIYIADWVLVDYPNHLKGRIWKLSAKEGRPLTEPRPYYAPYDGAPELARMDALVAIDSPSESDRIFEGLKDEDPWIRHAAVVALSRTELRETRLQAIRNPDGAVRLGALLAWMRVRDDAAPTIAERLLEDPDPKIRRMALMWIGERTMESLRGKLKNALAFDDISADLFETYLAAEENLIPEFVKDYRTRAKRSAKDTRRKLEDDFLLSLVRNENYSDRVRSLALGQLKDLDKDVVRSMLIDYARTGTRPLKLEAIRSLALAGGNESHEALIALALDAREPQWTRTEALTSLNYHPLPRPEKLLALMDDAKPQVQAEAVRALRNYASLEDVRQALLDKRAGITNDPSQRFFLEQIEYALFPPGTESADRTIERPQNHEQWRRALAEGGDPEAGRRVFFSSQTNCAQCHAIENRGGRLGPALSNIGQSVDRRQIIESILNPSDAFPPQYQAWIVETKDGDEHTGIQIDHKSQGAIEMFTLLGVTKHWEGDEIESYSASRSSLMPEGLENAMTVTEFRDLVAFLESLR